MKIFRGKYINDFFKDLITRYSINEEDFNKLVSCLLYTSYKPFIGGGTIILITL